MAGEPSSRKLPGKSEFTDEQIPSALKEVEAGAECICDPACTDGKDCDGCLGCNE